MTTKDFRSAPPWMRWILWAAAVYNLTWGAGVILFPTWPFELAGMEPPNYPSLWQCIGMIVGVYGVGYGIAASDPLRHWPIVLVGLLGKVFGPVGFLWTAWRGELPWITIGWSSRTGCARWLGRDAGSWCWSCSEPCRAPLEKGRTGATAPRRRIPANRGSPASGRSAPLATRPGNLPEIRAGLNPNQIDRRNV